MKRNQLLGVFLVLATAFVLFSKPVKAQYPDCGDDYCDVGAGEDCFNCAIDCGTCPSAGGSIPPGGGSCGDGFCDVLSGERCCNLDGSECSGHCVPDCGVCPVAGWERCGTGTCADGQTYWIDCYPSCSDPNQTCYNTPACNWPPSNCNTSCSSLGNPAGWGSAPCDAGGTCCCPTAITCPGYVGCGVVRCGTGGNCYSDCSDCTASPPPPPASPDTACIEVGPTAPVLYSPANGTTDIHSTSVTLDWLDVTSWGTACPTNTNQYRAYMDTSSPPTTLVCTTGSGTTTCVPPTVLVANQVYYWRVCADNGAWAGGVQCSSIWSFTPTNEPPSAPTSGSPQGGIGTNEISFQWYHDGDWGTNLAGATNRFYVDYTTTSGSYNWAAPDCTVVGGGAGNYSCGPFTLSWDTTYYWTVRASNNGNNFTDVNTWVDSAEWSFIPNYAGWFQTTGGDVHADGAFAISIPADTCSGVCEPYLTLNDALSTPANLPHGILSYGNSYDLGTTADDTNIAEDGYDWRTNSQRGFPDYDYTFWSEYLADDVTGSFGGGDITSSGTGVYTMTGTSLNGTVASGEQIIILRDGDLTIDSNLQVANGGFLMVISSGTVTIDSGVGATPIGSGGGALTATTANVQGVFVANSIQTPSNGTGDLHLWLAGTFVGWNSVVLERDLGGSLNNTEPAETFFYRPDFLVNAPSSIKRSVFDYQQIVP